MMLRPDDLIEDDGNQPLFSRRLLFNRRQRLKEINGILITDDTCANDFIALAVKKHNTWWAEKLEAREKRLILLRIGCHICLQQSPTGEFLLHPSV